MGNTLRSKKNQSQPEAIHEIENNIEKEKLSECLPDKSDPSKVMNWNDIPNETKTTIVQYLGLSERLALRACSKHFKQVVDSVPFNMMDRLTITLTEDEMFDTKFQTVVPYLLHIYTILGNRNDPLWESYMTAVHYIRELKACRNAEVVMKRVTMKVGKFIVDHEIGSVYELITKLQPFHLKSIHLFSDGGDNRIYDLPQMILAKDIHISNGCCITNEQLLKLTALKIDFNNCQNLTVSGINKFALKFIENPEFERFSFSRLGESNCFGDIYEGFNIDELSCDSEVPIIKTLFPKIQMQLGMVEGTISGRKIGTTEDYKNLKTLNWNSEYVWFELYSHEGLSCSDFENEDQIEQAVAERLNNVDYIKKVGLTVELNSPLKNNIPVGSITFNSPNDLTTRNFGCKDQELLRKVDISCLKEVTIVRREVSEEVFDIEQIINAERLYIANCTIRDDQLLKLNARCLRIENTKGQHITAAGINKFLKKCLKNLDEVNYLVTIYYCDDEETYLKDLLEGLDYIDEDGSYFVVCESLNYLMQIRTRNAGLICARRIYKIW